MKHLGRKIIRAIEEENETIPAELLSEVPNYQLIEDPSRSQAENENVCGRTDQ